jgi:aspartyl-tRNA synthetase
MRTLIVDIPAAHGTEVMISGWVDARRDHGKIAFIDVRDYTGTVQVVLGGALPEADKVRVEYVVSVRGTVKERPASMVNDTLPNRLGHYEIEASVLTILNASAALPLAVTTDGYEIGEEVRMKYRYLDLRRPRLQKNLRTRHAVLTFIRTFLTKQGFVEVETPYLSKSTPEGARDYLVPSRVQPGKFYALPQSPQQYKQLLMVSGTEKYFQIVRCFRDEDTRADRQAEFTQLDLEMSFVNQEDVLGLIEELYLGMAKALFPNKKLKCSPDGRMLRMTHAEAAEQYNSDRPDLRDDPKDENELAFVLVTDFPMFEVKDNGSWGAAHHPFTLPTYDTALDAEKLQHEGEEWQTLMSILDSKDEALKLRAYQYDLVLNGHEVAGGSIRTYEPRLLSKVFQRLGYATEEIQEKFGHILEAFSYGAPPHGGFASGIERLVAVLCSEQNIREVMAFPKTGDGRDLMMEAPSAVSKEQLDELGLKVVEKK